MRHPSKRLVVAFIISLIAGYGVSWLIMVGVLDTSYRLYGFTYLSAVAVLVAIFLVIFMDGPLNLHTFDWPRIDEAEQKKKQAARSYYNLGLVDWLTTVDHKKIGIMYFVFSFFFREDGTSRRLFFVAEVHEGKLRAAKPPSVEFP